MFKKITSSCPWLFSLLALLAIASAWWYPCHTKGVCGNSTINNTVARHEDNNIGGENPADVANVLRMGELVVHFYPNSSKVTDPEIDKKLHKIAEYLDKVPSAKVRVTGHTSVHKNQEYTDRLGLERARQMENLLVKYGAPGSQIILESRGQRDLIVKNPTTVAEGAPNRRVVLTEIK
jgi:outer membrane protein OmpA-like peptidoglycan-associated protein